MSEAGRVQVDPAGAEPDDGEWDEPGWSDDSDDRRLGLSDALRGVGLALGAGLLIALAGVGTVVVLLVASLGPTHRTGPGDGRHSRRLPVALSPATALQAGMAVRVRASRLAGANEAVIAQCAAEADTAERGVAACDLAHRSQVSVHRGRIDSSFRVSRSIDLRGGRRVDCAPKPARCVLIVASAENYDRSGFAPLTFLGDEG